MFLYGLRGGCWFVLSGVPLLILSADGLGLGAGEKTGSCGVALGVALDAGLGVVVAAVVGVPVVTT